MLIVYRMKKREKMCEDLKKAIRVLNEEQYTCVLCKGGAMYKSTERGVKPLLDWLNSGMEMKGFSAADKVVGKAAALLYVLLGVKEVYAHVMSESAIDILEKNSIHVQYDISAEHIINRAGTGFCPMEKAVWDIEDAWEGKRAVEKRLAEMAYTRNRRI